MGNTNKVNKNEVTCCGVIKSKPELDYKYDGEAFYKLRLGVNRRSGTVDDLDVLISDRLIDIDILSVGMFLKVNGDLRSYNFKSEVKTRLLLQLFAHTVDTLVDRDNPYINDVSMTGFICKEVTEKVLRDGKHLGYCMIAVNRTFGKTSYIPVLLWGRNVSYVKNLGVGVEVEIKGRLQSREYPSKETGERIRVQELSISSIKEYTEEEDTDVDEK